MKVNCSYKKLIVIEELKPNPDNPNRHSNEQIEKLAAVINYQGWRAPIVVSNLSGYIVKGHGRLMAAEKAGYKKVPVDFQDYDSLEQEKADLIADNRLAELSEWNDLKLNDMLAELNKSENLDIELSGYSADEFSGLAEGLFNPNESPSAAHGEVTQVQIDATGRSLDGQFQGKDSHLVNVTCPHCGDDFSVSMRESS
jgi:hypothetical protein